MNIRHTTENNEKDNCEFYNRQHCRAHAKQEEVPVIAFDAVHEGTAQETGMPMSDEFFKATPRRLQVVVGAPVLLLHNLAVEHGLMNGSQGTVENIVFSMGDHPNHDRVANRMPSAVIITFPGYSGPPLFPVPDPRTWVILEPREQEYGERAEIKRKQFCLCLAWSLTPWKAQGMTLEKVIVRLSHACSKPGVLFVALTCVRHPDNLFLDGDFPAFSTLRRQLLHPSFAARQRWERRMLVLFSRTIRWDDHTNAIADEVDRYLEANPYLDGAAVLVAYA